MIIVLVDDLGWTDLACAGSIFYETPNIDRLAAEGMRFTNAYSACTVCSPTRASILTGKYPARLHLTDWIPGHALKNTKLLIPDWTQRLPHEEVTLAEALKSTGYASASIGKWHLGDGDGSAPTAHGFDVNVAGSGAGQPPSYFYPYARTLDGREERLPGLDGGREGEYLTDRLTGEAERFLEAHHREPFFLYLPYFAVHAPIQAKEELVAKYAEKARTMERPGLEHKNPGYAAMIQSLDESIGRILQKLEELKIAERTVVFFTSDNGGLLLPHSRWGQITSNAPLREGKGSAYEGGVRVPLIVRWPGVARPGSVCSTPVISLDLYPTVLEMAGVRPGPAQIIDGESLVPLLKRDGTLGRDALFWHYPHYHPGKATPYGAIRAGDYRLVEFYEDMRVELYNLKNDLGETTDLAPREPERAEELRQRLHAWRKAVGAQMPAPNPSYKPEAAAVEPLAQAHAHNDYLHTRPLLDALEHGFTSVEADIFLVKGELLVGHDLLELKPERGLEALYLKPLLERARRNGGRIYPGGPAFTLLIDIKSEGEETYAALSAVLEKYAEMLTAVSDGKVEARAVTVIISGNRAWDRIAAGNVRYAAIDGRLADLDSELPAHLLPLISDNWRLHFAWRGDGAMPESDRRKLADVVRKVHARGRRLRFWGTPDNLAFWRELAAAGVDLINTDDLEGLKGFLLTEKKPVEKEQP